MATVPTPQSYSQILGTMIGDFLSSLAIPQLQTGTPSLSWMEAAAQGDLRQTQNIFEMLNSNDLDRATGTSLDRIGASEKCIRRGETSASGYVTVSDASFAKISSQIFQGLAAPIVGSGTIYVLDASLFPATGQIYIGRGTERYEGPLGYTAVTSHTTYWEITLSSTTAQYHNLNESVILAQGGDRAIPAGTTVQTDQGNASEAVTASVLYSATLLDGEDTLSSVTVVATDPGVVGNVIAGSLRAFVSAPFTGAAVTNPSAFTNGLATEQDNEYRERIRSARASRSKATPTAIISAALGAQSLSENKTVTSAALIRRTGSPSILYIDDGTGYEESDLGVALETLQDDATGGEQYFQLIQGRPTAKASLISVTAPFLLSDGSSLAVDVAGVITTHTFSASEFRTISSATAYEISASVNRDSSLKFSARTAEGGTKVVLVAKDDSPEDLRISSVPGIDANNVLQFPSSRAYSLRLFRNDRILYKDGRLASVQSNTQSSWGNLVSGETLCIQIDGVSVLTSPADTYTISNSDFVAAGTEYTTVASTNSLASWAKVLNYKIPGITATVSGATLVLSSNRGRSNTARVSILSSTLVSKGVFNISDVSGQNNDYSFDRNIGQVRLNTALSAGDTLTVGTENTRGFIESSSWATATVNAVATSVAAETGAEMWFAVDGRAEFVVQHFGSIVISLQTAETWGDRVRIASSSASVNLFTEAVVGDWLILTDSALSQDNRGCWRVADVDASGHWIDIERPAVWASPETVSLVDDGAVLVRLLPDVIPQRVYAADGLYTPTSLVSLLTLDGATAELYRTTQIRVKTNRYSTNGDIALLACNSEAKKFLFTPSESASEEPHYAAVESSIEAGTPQFAVETVSTVTSETEFDVSSIGSQDVSRLLVGLTPLPDPDARYSNRAFVSPISGISGTTITARESNVNWLPEDRLYSASPFAISPRDTLAIVVDQDETEKRFVSNMFRRTAPAVGTSYGASITLTDEDNSNQSLAVAFTTAMNWNDFAVFMPARVKSHYISGADTNQTIVWRYANHGVQGERAGIRYIYPTAPSQAVLVTPDSLSDSYSRISVRLPSDVARTGVTYSNSMRIGYRCTNIASSLYTQTFVLNLPIATATSEIRLDYYGKTAGWSVGETISGQSSLATGTIASVVGGAPGAAAGTIVLTGVAGGFSPGELLDGTVAGVGVANATATQYGYVTATLTLPSGISDHGFAVSDALHFEFNGTGTGAGFVTGSKTIAARTASTVSYTGPALAIAPTASVGTVSFADSECTLTGSTVAVGDIFKATDTSLPSSFEDPVKILTLASNSFTTVTPVTCVLATTLLWAPITATSNLAWYPISSTDAAITAIATAVNAQTGSPISAVAVGDGAGDTSGVILYATYEAAPDGIGAVDPWYYFADGVNYVQSHTNPPNTSTDFVFTLKNAVEPSLATNSDWENEDVRLVPLTAVNVVGYLNKSGPGGLFANSSIAKINSGRVQISTDTLGSEGTIEVQGGTANSFSTTVQGSAVQAGSYYALLTVQDATGLDADQWVRATNAIGVPKVRIDSTTNLSSLSADGTVIFDLGGTPAWAFADIGAAPITGLTWKIEKQGEFVCFQYLSGGSPNLTGVYEGDWVHVAGSVATLNQGLFRIIRVNNTTKTFWLENPNAVEEAAVTSLAFLTYDSIVPGDKLVINTSLWGSANIGTWTVAGIDLSTYDGAYTDNTGKFWLTLDRAITPISSVGALGASAGLVRVIEGIPSSLVKQIRGICVNPDDITLSDVKLTTWYGCGKVGETAGSVLTSLDKLEFPTSLVRGQDGYRYATGLIGEVNKIEYGYEADPTTYPGTVAAGDSVNIEGPQVKRIQVALAVRPRSGVSLADLKGQVRSTVASTINNSPVGTSIALSQILSAAQSVYGVSALTLLSPTFNAGNDLLVLQPYEKALVLSPEDDIAISFTGV